MAISEIIKEIREEKKINPAKIAMDFLSSAAGVKLIKGVIKTKAKLDKRVKNVRDFAGMPSYSDQDKVERAIARVGSRLRDVEKLLDELDNSLNELETNAEENRKRKTARRKETIVRTRKVVKSPKTDTQTLTNVIDLLKPVKKSKGGKPRRKASEAKTSKRSVQKAKVSKSTKKKSKKKVATPFIAHGSEKLAAVSLLDINFKK